MFEQPDHRGRLKSVSKSDTGEGVAKIDKNLLNIAQDKETGGFFGH
jgi:hypothetical protein